MKKTVKVNKGAIGLSFFLCLLLSFSVVYKIERDKVKVLQNKTKYVTSAEVSKLQYVMNTLLLKTQTLEMLIVENDGEIRNFNQIAEQLYDNPAIRSLQLAPDGVVSYVYPLKGNEDAFGDLFHDPERAAEARAARDSGELTLSGPFELYQGGLGVVGRRPIYLSSKEGGREFWGFAIIVLDLPDAFLPARLNIMKKEGFEYKLYRIHPDTQKVQIIDQSCKKELSNPEEISFQVPNGEWIFSVMPEGGWLNKKSILFETMLALTGSLLVTFLVGFIRQLRKQKKELYQITVTDTLTGLGNYTGLMAVLEKYSMGRKPFTLFFMDLDGFKRVNDTYGHQAGNGVLKESAKRMQDCLEEYGTVFRNGGDEFCAVLPGKHEDKFCCDTAKRIIESINRPFVLDGRKIPCGVSIGFARYPEDEKTMEAVMKEADKRMYAAKKAGKELKTAKKTE